MFNIFKDKNGTTVALDQKYNNVGYSSFINYFNSNTLKLDENYNGAYQGTIPGGAMYYKKLQSCGNWFVNAYCIGSVGEDTLDIAFQAYNQTIHFDKVVEQA